MRGVLKRLLPHGVAVVLFMAISLAYFAPQLQGRRVAQHDREQWLGIARELIDYRDSTGRESLWTTTLFGGMPSILVSQGYPKNVVEIVDRGLQFLGRPASYIFLTMLGFYILLLVVGVNPWLAIPGAVAYGLSTYFLIIVGAGHNAKSHALCYVAPMVAGFIAVFRGKYWGGGLLFALSLALGLVAGHLQITYYGGFVLAALAVGYLVMAIREGRLLQFGKAVGVLLVAMLFAVGANFNRLYQTWDYGKESIRGKSDLVQKSKANGNGLDREYATAWSYGPEETFNLFVPNFNGGSSSLALASDSHVGKFLDAAHIGAQQKAQLLHSMPVYWGSQPMTSGPVYLGAVVVFLFVLGLFLLRGAEKWALVAVSALAVLLAWGYHFGWLTNLFFDWVPGYNKFRTVSMVLVVCELTVPLLAFWGLSKWQSGEVDDRRLQRGLLWATVLSGGVALLLLLLAPAMASFVGPHDAQYVQSGFPQELMDALRADRVGLMRMDAFRSLLFVLVTAGCVFLLQRKKLKLQWFGVLLTAVVLVDMWVVDKRYDGVHWESAAEYEKPFTPSQADVAILRDTGYYRVYNTTVSPFNDASTSYFHRSVGGYHGAKMRRFQEFVDRYGGSELFLNLLNVKYVIARGSDGQPMAQFNPRAFGSAWLVDSVLAVQGADAELDALQSVDLQRVAVVDASRFPLKDRQYTPHEGDTIALTQFSPDRMVYRTATQAGGYAVLSDVYYPKGWCALLDGGEVPVTRVDYLLRGVEIPAGIHRLELSFTLPSFYWGQWVDFGFGLVMVLVLVSWCAYEGRRSWLAVKG